jgi:hypothetical protein
MTIPFEKNIRLVWVAGWDGIADINAPTTAELDEDNIVDLTCVIPADGWDPGIATNSLDDGSLCTDVAATAPGNKTVSPTLTGKRYRLDTRDILWPLVARNAEGFLVERRQAGIAEADLDTVAWDDVFAVDDEVTVIKVILGDPQPNATAANANMTFGVPTFVQDFAVKATVVAPAGP